jgi:hypothetical protein
MGTVETPEPPFELTAMAMVNLGPQYARLLVRGKKGASSIFHITPLGHAELGRRLKVHAQPADRHE